MDYEEDEGVASPFSLPHRNKLYSVSCWVLMIRRRKRRSFSALFPLTTASSFSSQVFSPSTPLSSSLSTWPRLSFVALRNSFFNSIFLLSSLMAEKELFLPVFSLQFLKGLRHNGIANILPFSFQCVKKYHFDRIDYHLKSFLLLLPSSQHPPQLFSFRKCFDGIQFYVYVVTQIVFSLPSTVFALFSAEIVY